MKSVAAKHRTETAQKQRLLTVAQAAIYLGRSEDAIRHMIGSGKIRPVRGDRRISIDVRDLDDWITTNKEGTTTFERAGYWSTPETPLARDVRGCGDARKAERVGKHLPAKEAKGRWQAGRAS